MSGQQGTIGGARVRVAQRNQVEWSASDLESLLPEEHRARALWSLIERLDLSRFYETIASKADHVGRPATDPKILLALWVYATSEGIGSARHLDRLCKRDAAYRWICGGVAMNAHTLSDFRVEHGDALDGLMTQVIAALMHNGILHLRRTAQDGTRVRASAGAASFRRRATLEQCAQTAEARIEELRRELESDPAGVDARHRAAKERAAKARSEAIARALEQMPQLEAVKVRRAARDSKKKRAAQASQDDKKTAPRASTTDPDARVMKMADGGFRPAYNVQFSSDTESRFIVGVDVHNVGSDQTSMTPMLDQIEKRTGIVPNEHLVDGGFLSLDAIERAHRRGVTVYAPPPPKRPRKATSHPGRKDSPAIAAWRMRMAQPTSAEIYKLRAATAETIHADLRRWRGFDRFVVRGLAKVRAVSTLVALTHNLIRWAERAA